MTTDEEILEECIRSGKVDLSIWPELLPRLISRLESIARTNFPPPTAAELTIPTSTPAQSASQATTLPDSAPSSQPPPSPNSPSTAPAPGSTSAGTTTTTLPLTSGLHPDDASTLTSLTSTLQTFTSAPPHTFQRLFELILSPNKPYKSLPQYLRALSRTLSVYSPSTAFPLPSNSLEASDPLSGIVPSGALTNGDQHTPFPSLASAMGSDESLGGALLTPIPWLEGVDAESAARNGVSQGELLRKEQELNIVPANQVEAQGRAGSDASEGPPEIGAQDVGPQPEGTVFPDPPRSEEEIELKKDGGEENEEEKKEGKTEKESDRGEEKQEEKEEEAKKDDAADADGDMVMDEKADDKAVVKEAEQSKADGEKDVDMDAPAEMEVEAAGGGDKAKDEDAMKE